MLSGVADADANAAAHAAAACRCRRPNVDLADIVEEDADQKEIRVKALETLKNLEKMVADTTSACIGVAQAASNIQINRKPPQLESCLTSTQWRANLIVFRFSEHIIRLVAQASPQIVCALAKTSQLLSFIANNRIPVRESLSRFVEFGPDHFVCRTNLHPDGMEAVRPSREEEEAAEGEDTPSHSHSRSGSRTEREIVSEGHSGVSTQPATTVVHAHQQVRMRCRPAIDAYVQGAATAPIHSTATAPIHSTALPPCHNNCLPAPSHTQHCHPPKLSRCRGRGRRD